MTLEVSFSVIIPTFNRAKVISRAIDSVLNQTYKNFELIVVDDGSTDNTQEILKKYDQIKIMTQENQGVSSARNSAIQISIGEWICFLDSDDEWLPTKLESQKNIILSHPKIIWNHTNEIWIRNGVRVNQMKKHQKAGGDQFKRSLELCIISPSTVCIRKDILLAHLFREDFPVCEDYDLWLKLSSQYEIDYIEEPLIYKYGGHEDQLSRKYIAMDYFRLKSMFDLYQNSNLSNQQIDYLKEEFRRKAKVLLKGYRKHNNLTHVDEVEFMLANLS